ncbi:MAG: hypothetical protein RI560_02960 [Natronomonas sp.]|jgi:hypothetical protein|uniref:hypothetical protein n=1 Tax=Natronomonas sp. TaxID=2184060 RepID=UPI00286FD7C0|nr:hypothetical protein [Natronomonas sp.]MDR9380617.1 hypothetical protein [Natronomonas sp.]MDR9429124.1 hypothetical protein [Natronomonas sp.]
MTGEADAEIEPDPETAALVRSIAEDVRGENSEREQLAMILYRVSDLYDPGEEATPEEIHRNVRNILEIKARGGLPDRNG